MEASQEYAKALYDLSTNKQIKEDILYNLTSLVESLDQDIKNFFLHPEIKKEEKKKMISKIYEEGLFRDFLFVLIDNDRFSSLDEIKDEYQILVDNEKNILDVYVYSNSLLSSEYLDKLNIKLENKLNRKINITNEIDKSITAGIRIAYESKEIDMTLDSKFRKFKDELKESL